MCNTVEEVLRSPDFSAWMKENIERVSCIWNRNGQYTCEIYADYRDEIDLKTIKEILEAPDPESTFYDWITETYADTASLYENDIVKELLKLTPDDFLLPFDDEDIEDIFREWIMENVVFELPEEHYLDQEVCTDILVDVGDGNYDFTLNNPWEDEEADLESPSAVLWLMRQQGYGDPVIKECIQNPDCISHLENPKFMKSVYEECINLTSHMGVLTFLVKMSLRNLIELNSLMNERNKMDEKGMEYHPNDRKYTDYLVISNDTTCGLYDPWYGSGSEMDIKLEENVVLPIKLIDSAMPDGWRGYGIKEIYGVTEQWWEPGCAVIFNTQAGSKEA